MDEVEELHTPPKQKPEPRRLKPSYIPWYRRRKPIIFSCITSLLVIGVLFIAFFMPHGPSFPENIKDQIKFTSFFPSKLPEDYIIDTSSYSYQNGVLTFEVKTPGETTLLVSEQPQPANFDLNNFYKGLKDTQSTSTSYGTAQAGTFLKNRAGSMTALGTWVFVSAPPNTDIGQLLAFFSSLKKVS